MTLSRLLVMTPLLPTAHAHMRRPSFLYPSAAPRLPGRCRRRDIRMMAEAAEGARAACPGQMARRSILLALRLEG
jgi:hypothetical protein